LEVVDDDAGFDLRRCDGFEFVKQWAVLAPMRISPQQEWSVKPDYGVFQTTNAIIQDWPYVIRIA